MAVETFGFGGFLERLRQHVEATNDPLGELGELFFLIILPSKSFGTLPSKSVRYPFLYTEISVLLVCALRFPTNIKSRTAKKIDKKFLLLIITTPGKLVNKYGYD